MSLEKRVAVITGAAGGLGSALAHTLAGAGMRLALLGRNRERLEMVAAELALPMDRVFVYPVDVLDPAAARGAAEAIDHTFGQVDALLHTVGGWIGGKSLVEVPASELDTMLQQHVWSSFYTVQAFVPHMLRGGWGRIVMIGSHAARDPKPRGGAYAIAKAAQETLMMTLAQEIQGTGVTANLILTRQIDLDRKKSSADPAGNTGWNTPEELAQAVLFLLSEAGGTVNGVRIPMSGV